MMIRRCFYLSFCFLVLLSCKTYRPQTTFLLSDRKDIDYSQMKYWAAHPAKRDSSDCMPEGGYTDEEKLMVDVFFLHPTTCTGDKGQDQWNANIDDDVLNKKTDEGTILFQASAFNQAGKVYAPRYRQAHLQAYFTQDTTSALKAFDFAYNDIKNAFEYYLSHYNNGRPIIIASHSQGTNHAERLLSEYFDGKPLGNKLVAAYLVGMPIKVDRFHTIKPCENGSDVGCFVSWRTFKNGHTPKGLPLGDQICVTNPIKWDRTITQVPKSENKGTLLRDFKKVYPKLVDAEIHNGILWANKPKFPGSFFLRIKNYHVADINFYYMNIRENATLRATAFANLKK